MRIAIFGSGGVGAYFGGRLALTGQDVTFIARGDHLKALRSTGLKVDSLNGDFVVHPAKATADPSEIGLVDLVVLGVKAWQAREAARAMKPLIGPGTAILPLQNGVDTPAQLIEELGPEPVLGGLCRIVSFVVEPGHIRHAGFEPSITLGELDNRRSHRVEHIQQTFTAAGIDARIAQDIEAAIWRKFLFIAAFSGIGAFARTSAGSLRNTPETRALLLRAMEEIYALARRRNIQLPADAIEQAMAGVDALPEDATSSMERDIAAGRPSELESQSGTIVRMAQECGIDAPVHTFIYAALKPQETKARKNLK